MDDNISFADEHLLIFSAWAFSMRMNPVVGFKLFMYHTILLGIELDRLSKALAERQALL